MVFMRNLYEVKDALSSGKDLRLLNTPNLLNRIAQVIYKDSTLTNICIRMEETNLLCFVSVRRIYTL